MARADGKQQGVAAKHDCRENMATVMRTVLSLNLAAFTTKSRLILVPNRCLYLPFKYSQLSRRCSSIKEANAAQKQDVSQDLQLSDSCVKVR